MLEKNPGLKSDSPIFTDNFMLLKGGVLNIYSNLTDEDLELLAPNFVNLIQFARRTHITGTTLQLINKKLLLTKPNIGLRVITNGYGAFDDLDFLEYLSNLKNITADLRSKDEIHKINKHLQLETLAIGTTKVSIKEIVHQTSLKNLSIFDKPKDIQIVEQMHWIENLTFSNQSLKNLDFLKPLVNLKELHFGLGGTTNLSALPNIGKIERLSFLMVRQLFIKDLLPINDMKFIKELSFFTQTHLTDLEWLKDKSIKTEVLNCKNFKA